MILCRQIILTNIGQYLKMVNNLEIISVNYNTPDLVERLITSVKEKEGDYPIRIIDGSDREPFKSEIKALCEKHNVTIEQQGWNIHHGRGMDLGVSTSKYEWVLIMDSDNYILQPIIDKMFNAVVAQNKMICGYHCYVNHCGVSGGYTKTEAYPILYYHPMLLMIKTSYYNYLRQLNARFIHHGAPCISIMQYLHDNNISEVVGIRLADACGYEHYQRGEWVCLDSRGTRQRFGIKL